MPNQLACAVCNHCVRQQFLEEFLEVGGVLTVVEILNVKQAREADKTEALKLLICVSSAGRQYKELICEGYGQLLVAAIVLMSLMISSSETLVTVSPFSE